MYVSVVIPVYNDQEFIKECLDCIAQQTRQPDQVIVVDNNCSDQSMQIAQKYEFVTIVHESVQGICAATKKGLDYASRSDGIILRCDVDSRPHPDWVSSVIQLFTTHKKDIVAVTGPGIFYDTPRYLRPLADLLYMKLYFLSVGLALGQKPLFGSNFAITSSVWRSIQSGTHLNRQDIHDDIDISHHVIKHGNILYAKQLTMPISARPFASLRSFIKRYPMGLRSIILHWPEQAPWRRFTPKK